jgi:hypothetical protein
MDQAQIIQSQFAEKLEEMDNVRYNLERIHSKIGLQGFSEFEEIANSLKAFYESTLDDLIFEANADDPTNNYNTAWMTEVINACKLSMGEY